MDNATVENAGVTLYTGKITLLAQLARILRGPWASGADAARDTTPSNDTIWYLIDSRTIRNLSAVGWLTGQDLYNRLSGEVPIGLAMNAIGAHPIES